MHIPLMTIRCTKRLRLALHLFKPDMPRDQLATVGAVIHIKRQIPGITLDSLGLHNNGLIMHFDETLTCQWVTGFGTDSWDWVRTIQRDQFTGEYTLTGFAGASYTIGSLVLPPNPGRYSFIVRMSNAGTLLGGSFFAVSGEALSNESYPEYASTPINGPYYILVYANGVLNFTNGTLVNANAYLVRLDAVETQSISSQGPPDPAFKSIRARPKVH